MCGLKIYILSRITEERVFEHLDNMYGKEAVRFRLEVEEENERAVKAYKKAGFERLGYVQMAKDY